ncbi:hypothetical protein BD414DRAFT_147851 [Trametes punicea]|nr:hypothetical protein BD414DRAFT_147851 [Trametes punicea]
MPHSASAAVAFVLRLPSAFFSLRVVEIREAKPRRSDSSSEASAFARKPGCDQEDKPRWCQSWIPHHLLRTCQGLSSPAGHPLANLPPHSSSLSLSCRDSSFLVSLVDRHLSKAPRASASGPIALVGAEDAHMRLLLHVLRMSPAVDLPRRSLLSYFSPLVLSFSQPLPKIPRKRHTLVPFPPNAHEERVTSTPVATRSLRETYVRTRTPRMRVSQRLPAAHCTASPRGPCTRRRVEDVNVTELRVERPLVQDF